MHLGEVRTDGDLGIGLDAQVAGGLAAERLLQQRGAIQPPAAADIQDGRLSAVAPHVVDDHLQEQHAPRLAALPAGAIFGPLLDGDRKRMPAAFGHPMFNVQGSMFND